jgi:purine-binding chemotaxis protein CheW
MVALKQLCTFYLDRQYFGVEAQSVQEVIRFQEMTQVPLTPSCIRGLINLRGQIVTAIDMRERFGMKELPEGKLPMNVVVRGDDGAVSLLVDQIGDVIEVDDESFEPPPETLRGPSRELVRGAYKLDGKLLLVLNTSEAININSAE